nr:hypothetical protein [Streptomyces lavendulae]
MAATGVSAGFLNDALEGVAATGVSAGFLNDALEECVAPQKIVMIDCCRSGGFAVGLRTSDRQGDGSVAMVKASDVCITMGCGDTCPVFPGKRYLDWTLEDPAGQGVEAVRPIRDGIKKLVEKLIEEIAPANPEQTA